MLSYLCSKIRISILLQSIYAGSVASLPFGGAPIGSLVLVHVKLNAQRLDCAVTGACIIYVYGFFHKIEIGCLYNVVKSASNELCRELVQHFCDKISHAP